MKNFIAPSPCCFRYDWDGQFLSLCWSITMGCGFFKQH